MYALRQCLSARASLASGRAATWAALPGAVDRGERFELLSPGAVPIAATAFVSKGLADSGRARGAPEAIVIASATGVPQGLYRGFAAWLASQGVAGYTFDFRGVAASRPTQLRGFKADFQDWSTDINTVLDHALSRHTTVSLIGHSIGGFLGPVAESATKLQRLVLVGAQTALWRDWPLRHRLPMAVLWHGLMPAVTAAVGYFPGRALRLGEDLPRGVAMQWAGRPWRDPFGAGAASVPRERFARALPPVHLVAASDDAFATTQAQDRVAARLLQTSVRRHVWQPHTLGLRRLGHFDVFRPHAAALWPDMLAWASGI